MVQPYGGIKLFLGIWEIGRAQKVGPIWEGSLPEELKEVFRKSCLNFRTKLNLNANNLLT